MANALDERFQIVLVGADNSIDATLPKNIISVHRTQNQKELAEIYTAADVFINPTREEVFGLTNIEALACGTPVVTFDTGGSPECIDETCGVVVEVDAVDAMRNEIERICVMKSYSKEACLTKAQRFANEKSYRGYISLYKEERTWPKTT